MNIVVLSGSPRKGANTDTDRVENVGVRVTP